MNHHKLLAVCGAGAALACAAVAPALAGATSVTGTKVTVRIEGAVHTLLPTSAVVLHTGSVTAGGAPAGACSSKTAAGALNLSTRGHWSGSFSTKYGDYSVTSILGERHAFTSPVYWGLWVNNAYSPTGICNTKLRVGDRVLFAVDSVKHHRHPTAIITATTDRVGRALTVKVVYFTDAGKAKPLAGASVSTGGVQLKTNRSGVARLTPSRSGKLILHAGAGNYIRSVPVTVRVVK